MSSPFVSLIATSGSAALVYGNTASSTQCSLTERPDSQMNAYCNHLIDPNAYLLSQDYQGAEPIAPRRS